MTFSRIFIKGLPTSLTENEFRKHFSTGNRQVTDVKLIPQRRIGYVGYKTPEDAATAVKYFNKTYVRMSKIAVEPARAISDHTSNNANLTSQTAVPEQGSKEPSHSTGSKKRKREELDQSDPKLQEYLQVMRRGRESLVTHETTIEPGKVSVSTDDALVPEEESDDEYVKVPSLPSRQEKPHNATPLTGETCVSQPKEPITRKRNVAEALAGCSAASLSSTGQPIDISMDATDDDWLRSRTNRLLDLVDPDEISNVASGEKVSSGKTPFPEVRNAEEAPHSKHSEFRDTHDLSPRPNKEKVAEAISRTCRLFVRNLPYCTAEEDLRGLFEKFGQLDEVHLPVDAQGTAKGFAMILFSVPSDAVSAFQALDGATFQGRIIHIIPADAKRDHGVDEFAVSNLPLKKQNLMRRKREAASTMFNWNSLYMSQDAVNSSVAARLGVSKADVLDPTSADAAVKQAIAETSVIQETKAFFAANGVDLEAFKSRKRDDASILVKNFPYGTTMEELRKLFEEFGPVIRVLMPPAGTIAIVQFAQANHGKSAFGKLAYRRIGDSVLFLEKAPEHLYSGAAPAPAPAVTGGKAMDQAIGTSKLSVSDLLAGSDKADGEEVETTSLFIRNLNFATSTSRLVEAFQALDGFVSARVKTKIDVKKAGEKLSMGFGFAEFATKAQAQAALKTMDGYALDGHNLVVKASHKGHDAAEERKREDNARKAAAQGTKIIIKNLPFQTSKKDIRTLFGNYGQLRSVRVPKKADYTSRGFAFADFVTRREAQNALNALRDTHLLGRRLVLDFAEAEELDGEKEIEKMQRKVGGQASKMAWQKLRGEGRKKVMIGEEEEEGME